MSNLSSISFPAFRIHQAAVDLIAHPCIVIFVFFLGDSLTIPLVSIEIGGSFAGLLVIDGTTAGETDQDACQDQK
jgi:hypothetical protein